MNKTLAQMTDEAIAKLTPKNRAVLEFHNFQLGEYKNNWDLSRESRIAISEYLNAVRDCELIDDHDLAVLFKFYTTL
jgi:hypothetical protein